MLETARSSETPAQLAKVCRPGPDTTEPLQKGQRLEPGPAEHAGGSTGEVVDDLREPPTYAGRFGVGLPTAKGDSNKRRWPSTISGTDGSVLSGRKHCETATNSLPEPGSQCSRRPGTSNSQDPMAAAFIFVAATFCR